MAKKILFQTALTDVESSDLEGVGITREDAKGNLYRWCYAPKTAQAGTNRAIPQGSPVVHVGTQDSYYDEVEVPASSIAYTSHFAGIARTAIATGKYGWVQIGGIATYANVRVGKTAGDLGRGSPCRLNAGSVNTALDASGKTGISTSTLAVAHLIESPTAATASATRQAAVRIHTI